MLPNFTCSLDFFFGEIKLGGWLRDVWVIGKKILHGVKKPSGGGGCFLLLPADAIVTSSLLLQIKVVRFSSFGLF